MTEVKCPSCGANFISAEQAADIIGVSYSRVRAILARNPSRLSAMKVGKSWVIPEASARIFQKMPPHRPVKERERD